MHQTKKDVKVKKKLLKAIKSQKNKIFLAASIKTLPSSLQGDFKRVVQANRKTQVAYDMVFNL